MSPRIDTKAEVEGEFADESAIAEIEIDRASGKILLLSRAAEEVLGYANEELAGVNLSSVIHPDDADLVADGISIFWESMDSTELDARILCGPGDYRLFKLLVRSKVAGDRASRAKSDTYVIEIEVLGPLADASTDGDLSFADEYGPRDSADESSAVNAPPNSSYPSFAINPLTGLYQRDYLFYEYERNRPALGGDLEGLALLVVDIDRFSLIVKALGSAGASKVLGVVAHRFEDALGGVYPVAYLDEDRFGLLCLGVVESSQVEMITRTLRSILDSPVVAPDGEEVVVTACIGIALATDATLDAEELFSRAITAKDRAKSRGASKVEYFVENVSAESHSFDARTRRSFENEVRKSIDSEELVVLFQPIFSLDTGRIGGVEALVRMRNPDGGLIMPADFIPVAKEIGRLPRLGSQVATKALDALSSWRRSYPAIRMTLGINLSGDELDESELMDELIERVVSLELDKNAVFIELGTVSANPEAQCHASIARLTEAGIALSVDEFGAGTSALGLFSRYEVAQVKLDRSLMLGLNESGRSFGVLSGLVSLAHSLDAEVIGVGVERAEQIRMMRRLEIDRVQGFHLGQPMEKEQIDTQLELIAE